MLTQVNRASLRWVTNNEDAPPASQMLEPCMTSQGWADIYDVFSNAVTMWLTSGAAGPMREIMALRKGVAPFRKPQAASSVP